MESSQKKVPFSNHDQQIILNEFQYLQEKYEAPCLLINMVNLFDHMGKHNFVKQLVPFLNKKQIHDYVDNHAD